MRADAVLPFGANHFWDRWHTLRIRARWEKLGTLIRRVCCNCQYRGHAAKFSTLRLPSVEQHVLLVHEPTSNLKGSRWKLPSMYPVHRTLLTVTGLYKRTMQHCHKRCSEHTVPGLCITYRWQLNAASYATSESAPAVQMSQLSV